MNLIKYFWNGFSETKNHMSETIKHFHNIKDYLSIDNDLVLYNERIYIYSYKSKKKSFERAAFFSTGMERMKSRARHTYIILAHH